MRRDTRREAVVLGAARHDAARVVVQRRQDRLEHRLVVPLRRLPLLLLDELLQVACEEVV